MSGQKKRRPNAKSYIVDIFEQPRSMQVSFLDRHEMPSSSSFIVGERSNAQLTTDPSLLLLNFRGTIKLIWYLVADDDRYPHPYILEGDDCVEGVCTKTIKAKGEVVSFPGLSIRKVSWKEMERVLLQRVDLLKQHLPGMEFKMKSLREYNPRSVKICFQAVPQDAVHDYSVILKPVMTRLIHSKDPVPLRDPQIVSISECKGTVHGKTEVTLLVSNLKTDDVLVFFHYVSLHPRISWQAFAEILCITQTKHRQASILLHTPPFHNRRITEPKTVDVEIRLRDNSCSNTVKYTYTPTTEVVNRIQRRVKQKEPIYANYFSCLGAVTNLSLLVPIGELHQDDDKSASNWDETPKTSEFDMKPGKQQPRTLSKKEDENPLKSTSLSFPVGQPLEERKLEGFDSKEEIGEAGGRVDPDRLSRYLSLKLSIPKESITNGLPPHESYREEPDKEAQLFMEATGASSCKTITEKAMEKLSDFKQHSPLQGNSPMLCKEGSTAQETGICLEENKTEVPYKDNCMDDALNKQKELEHTIETISRTSFGISSEYEDDLSKVPLLSGCDILVHSDLSHLSTDFIPTVVNKTEAFKSSFVENRVLQPNTDSGYGGFQVTKSFSSTAVVPILEQSDSSRLEIERCTSHAEKDGKSTPTSQTTSPEAVNTTNDQQGAESNQSLGSSQNENESASEDGNREGDSHDHKDNDETEDDTFEEELIPPRATQRIDHRGGTISLTKCDIVLEIPPGALAEGQEEEIELSVDWNDRHIPPLNSTDVNVAPIVTCNPTGLKFLKPVSLKIPHCAILSNPEKCKAIVHYSHTDKDKEPDWKRLPPDGSSDVQVKCIGSYFYLRTYHFTCFTVTVNGVETVAKEIMCVPFGKGIDSTEDDQVIRLYLYDFHGSSWEKIEQREKNFGGKQLDTEVSYQVHQLHRGSVGVEMLCNTPGWVLDSDTKISISFDTIWNIQSWNRCKFTWTNKTGNVKFKCQIRVQQSQNIVLPLDIENHVKIPLKLSSFPRQFSSEQQAPSDPSGVFKVDVYGNQFILQNSTSLDSGLQGQHFNDIPEPIICYSLERELILLLDGPNPIGNNWKKLAELLGYNKYRSSWENKQTKIEHFSPTEQLLKLIQHERKICSLTELEEYMYQIERPDAAEVVIKYQKQSHQSISTSSTQPALTGRQAEQPMSTSNTPSPNDINQPLTDCGQPRYDFQLHDDGDTFQSERNEQVQSGSYPAPTSSSNPEFTTPQRPCTASTNDNDSTPYTNNNYQSDAVCKALQFDDPVEELEDGLKAFGFEKNNSK